MKIDTKLDCEVDVEGEADMILCGEGVEKGGMVGDEQMTRTSQVGKGIDK